MTRGLFAYKMQSMVTMMTPKTLQFVWTWLPDKGKADERRWAWPQHRARRQPNKRQAMSCSWFRCGCLIRRCHLHTGGRHGPTGGAGQDAEYGSHEAH